MDSTSEDAEQRFEGLFRQHAGQVRAYAVRRVGVDAADEIVAETFLVVWNRLDRVPDEPLPWLYSLARGAVSHHRRGASRRAALFSRIGRLDPPFATPDVAEIVGVNQAISDALRALSERDREVLRLAFWERLDAASAAVALGCSVTSFKVRLHRARRRLRQLLDAEDRYERTRATALESSTTPARALLTPIRLVEPAVLLDSPIAGDDTV